MDIKLEKLSGHAKDGKIGRVLVSVGDEIKTGDSLFEIESNKGNVTVKACGCGKIESIEVSEGMTVKIGSVLAKMTGQPENNETENKGTGFSYMSGLIKPQKQEISCDIAIIGGGPGGYVAAIQGAMLGAKVALIEKECVGGTCLNWGCIPTKALVRSSEVFKNIKEAEEYGLYAENVSADMKKVVDRKNGIVQELTGGIEYLLEKHNITLVRGNGKITDKDTVFVLGKKMETTVKAKNIIIASGSKTANIPIPGVDLPKVITSKEALDLDKLPKKLVIVGGGVIGMEFAFMFNNFGVEVSVVEFFDSVLNMLDCDVREEITDIAQERGIKIYAGAKVQEIHNTQDGEYIVSFKKDEQTKYISTEMVLMAVGRTPVTEELGIEEIGIEQNEKKRGIKVNERLQTSIPNIYAIGDVTNKVQLAHVASHQGIIAVKNIMGQDCTMNYDVIPGAIFTDPEIASVGISEKAAKEKGLDVVIGKFPLAANGKALTMGEKRGFVKLIKEKESGKIIGGSIIGPHATDLIAEVALAVQNGLTAENIIETIHAHPTTAEAIHEAALSAEGGAIHFAS
jgi:dihydrolipoamide dehydrogenase